MKKWLKSLSKEQIQRYVFVGLLVLVFTAFFVSLSIASNSEKKPTEDPIETPDDGQNNNNDNNNNNNNEENNNENTLPTPEKPTVEKIILPIEGDFTVVRKYYDSSASVEDQELAVIQFGKRYYTSNGLGIASSDNKDFNVLACLSGEIVSVDESPIYGIVVTIKHNDDLYSEYSSLSKATVVAGSKVSQGDIIGVSGVCEYDSSLESHVYFKVMSNNETFNPTEVVGKTTAEVTHMKKVYSAE